MDPELRGYLNGLAFLLSVLLVLEVVGLVTASEGASLDDAGPFVLFVLLGATIVWSAVQWAFVERAGVAEEP